MFPTYYTVRTYPGRFLEAFGVNQRTQPIYIAVYVSIYKFSLTILALFDIGC